MEKIILITNTEEIKKARRIKGFSCRDMAKLLNFKSPATYCYIELGKTEPKVGQALKISKLLKEPLTKFFTLKVQY